MKSSRGSRRAPLSGLPRSAVRRGARRKAGKCLSPESVPAQLRLLQQSSLHRAFVALASSSVEAPPPRPSCRKSRDGSRQEPAAPCTGFSSCPAAEETSSYAAQLRSCTAARSCTTSQRQGASQLTKRATTTTQRASQKIAHPDTATPPAVPAAKSRRSSRSPTIILPGGDFP